MPFLDWLLTYPLLCNARCTVHGRHGHRHPCRGAEAVSHGAVQQATEILQLQFIDKVFDVLVVQVQQFSGAVGEETVVLQQLQPVEHGHCRCHPVVVQRQLPGGSGVRKL